MMLSTLALRTGAFRSLAKPQATQRAIVLVQNRCASSGLTEQIEKWDSANQIFYGPERDTKNFPHPVQPETSPPVRLGFIPDAWFQFFYNKTGVTGPYLFGTGLVLTLLSKEIWVIDHNFSEVIGFWGAFIFLTKKLGPFMNKHLDQSVQAVREDTYERPLAEGKVAFENTIKEAELDIWREDGQKYIFESKKENIDLQLEAIYRKRLQEVYQQVKRRLDYQLDIQNTKRRFEQEHMVNWIVNGVVSSITPQQEKESISKCIADLKTLSAS
ncbi:ATP synthase subunit b, mitochondrial-like [Liolophura sinensis]|uniref:ATP synthase subunit b, mitochondrial-like n=1 Tax=Liolophura sinensis TaxID=3198878 RepID=UPI003158B882